MVGVGSLLADACLAGCCICLALHTPCCGGPHAALALSTVLHLDAPRRFAGLLVAMPACLPLPAGGGGAAARRRGGKLLQGACRRAGAHAPTAMCTLCTLRWRLPVCRQRTAPRPHAPATDLQSLPPCSLPQSTSRQAAPASKKDEDASFDVEAAALTGQQRGWPSACPAPPRCTRSLARCCCWGSCWVPSRPLCGDSPLASAPTVALPPVNRRRHDVQAPGGSGAGAACPLQVRQGGSTAGPAALGGRETFFVTL